MLDHLNAEQSAAVLHGDAPLLVVAGAGSGKTLTLATRMARLVLDGADPRRILLMSFSRRAAAEMARRAGRLLHQALGLPSTTHPPELPWCGTFHSVAARLLRDHAGSLGLAADFSVIDRSDTEELLAIINESGLTNIKTAPFNLEFALETQLAGMFPNPGDEEKIRQIYIDNLTTDTVGMGVHKRGEAIHFHYPTMIVVGTK